MRKTKASYFESLNTKKIRDNRNFWKNVVPFFTNKGSRGEKIILTEAKKTFLLIIFFLIFNTFFSNVVSDLKIPHYCNYFPPKNICSLSTTIETFKKDPSIINTKKGNLIQYFYSERLLKKRCWKLSRI